MKTILVTGASGFLGTTVCQTFLLNKWQVVSLDRREPAHAQTEDRFHFIRTDLLNEQQVENAVQQAINRYDGIDAAALIAGGFDVGSLTETSSEDFKKMFDLNFVTALNVARPLINYFKADNIHGRIALVGGKPGLDSASADWAAAYGLSKSLVFQLADYINHFGKDSGIVAATIVPSIMDTPPNREAMPDDNPADWVSTQQVADTIAFFCSDQGSALREPILKVYGNS